MNTKEELRAILEEHHSIVTDELGEKLIIALTEYIKQSNTHLLNRVREEVIGEDEYPDEHFPTVLSGKQIERYDKVTARDRLRATQRTKLDQLSKGIK